MQDFFHQQYHPSTTQQYSPRISQTSPNMSQAETFPPRFEDDSLSACLKDFNIQHVFMDYSPSLRLHLVLSGYWLVASCADQLIIIYSEKSRIRLALLNSHGFSTSRSDSLHAMMAHFQSAAKQPHLLGPGSCPHGKDHLDPQRAVMIQTFE